MTISNMNKAMLLACALGAASCGGSTPPAAEPAYAPEVPSAEPAAPPADTAAPAATSAPAHGAEKSKDEKAHAPHWSYSGEGSPDKWGKLSPDFALCSTGKSQTPIDLGKVAVKADKAKAPALKFSYQPIPLKLVNNGHTIQVNNSTPSSIMVGTEKYDLAQLHFHSPSEHTVDGKHFDMELHLVHKNAAGQLAVVGVLLKKGKENKALAAIWESAPADVSKEDKVVAGANVDVSSLLPAKASYYQYSGSLTTPPCSEGVSWFVMVPAAEVSEAQVTKFRGLTHGETSRPVQPLGDRKVNQVSP